jgi:ankyrin repeat protein
MSPQDELFAAVRRGDGDNVAQLLDADPSLLTGRDGGTSPILVALYHGHPAIARLLADRGAPIGFFEAAALGNVDRVRELVSADASVLARYSDDGYAPFGFATFFGHAEVDRFLIDAGADIHAQSRNSQRVGAIHAAAAVRDHEMVELLLSRGVDPNVRQQNDYAPLHTAAGRGDRDMATVLLRHGADRDALTADGKTAADIAREHGHETFGEWLASYR